jgi:hypothetical protein
MWLRALIACDDIRLEAGGTVSLVGVYADTIFVPPGDGEIVLPRLSTFTIVGGLRDVPEISWRQSLMAEDVEPGQQIAGGRDLHDPASDEHRIVNIMTPLVLPAAGRYRIATEIETRRERRTFEHHFAVARLAHDN